MNVSLRRFKFHFRLLFTTTKTVRTKSKLKKKCVTNYCLMRFFEQGFIDKAAAWFRRLVASLAPKRPGFYLGPVHADLEMDKAVLEQVCFRSNVVCHL